VRAVIDEQYLILNQLFSDLGELFQSQVDVFVLQLVFDILLLVVGADVPAGTVYLSQELSGLFLVDYVA